MKRVKPPELPEKKYILLFLFLFALAVRLYKLDRLPATFYLEEMTNTYVGRFILLHGKDIYGHILPLLYFDKFGDYPPVLPLYLSGIGTFLFGVTEFAGRFPIALIGAFFVVIMFKLSMLLFKDKKTAVFTSLVAAILPWHVVLSRTTAEGVVGLTVYAWGLLYVLRSILLHPRRHYWYGLGLFLLGYLLYPSLRLLVPLSLLPIPFIAWRMNRSLVYTSFVGMGISVILTFFIVITPWGRARFDQTSLFRSPLVAASVKLRSQNLANGLGPNQVVRAKIFHNKYVSYSRELLNQYLSYFSAKYLFFEGGGQYRYYNVPDQGLLFVSLAVFLLAAYFPPRGVSRLLLAYTAFLLLVSPLPSALTVDFTPHVHRSMFMIFPVVLLAGSGFAALSGAGRIGKGIIVILTVTLFFEFVYFWHQYEWQSPGFQSVLRNDGDKALMLFIREHRGEYEQIYTPADERMGMWYLFYTNNFSTELIGKFGQELRIGTVDNIFFLQHQCPFNIMHKEDLPTKHLLVQQAMCGDPQGYKVIHTIGRRDGTEAYRLLVPES